MGSSVCTRVAIRCVSLSTMALCNSWAAGNPLLDPNELLPQPPAQLLGLIAGHSPGHRNRLPATTQGVADDPLVAPAFMVLSGLSVSSSATLQGALGAEIYGTRHLGAIRAPAASGGVFASALAPGIMGLLLDWRVGIDLQLVGMAVYTLVSAGLLAGIAPRLIAVPDGSHSAEVRPT